MIGERVKTYGSLTIWRRHTAKCKFHDNGRSVIDCSCPLWADGYVGSKRELRKSLGTRDLARARRKLAELMSSEVQVSKSITEAVVEFTSYCRTDGLEYSTLRKYKNTLNHLQEFCVKENIDSIGDLKVVHLDAFRASRKLAKITSSKELELLRQFCGFCRDRDWCKNNVARRIKSPRGIEPNEIVPFELAEVKAIIEASCKIGRSPYERLRANAMVLTLRYTALRISDVATLRRDRISKIGGRWHIFLRTTKNKKPIFMPIPNKMKAALDRVPLPRSGKGGGAHIISGVVCRSGELQ